MDKLIVFVKSSYYKDLGITSLIIVYQVSYNKKQEKKIKPFNGKVGHMTKISCSSPMLDGEILSLHFEI